MFIQQIELRELHMRLVHPFETSFGVTEDRRIILVKATGDGRIGYGEVTAGEGPFYNAETTDTAWHILRDFIIPRALGKQIEHAADFGSLVRGIRGHNMAKAGLETALWDLEAQLKAVSLWKFLGGTRKQIDCGVSIGIQPSIDKLLAKIDREVNAGYRRVKIKIRPGWDIEVVRAVRQTFPQILLMVDANSAYTLADVELFKEMELYNVMMFEQPLDWEDMIDHAELQMQIDTPVCLDESIHSAEDARRAIRIGACRIINIKLGRVGGFAEAKAVHDVCRDHGVPVWCGGMLESGVGRLHNIALSSLENFSLPGDVSASSRYWAEDIVHPPIEISSSGQITQRDGWPSYYVKEDLIARLTARAQVFAA